MSVPSVVDAAHPLASQRNRRHRFLMVPPLSLADQVNKVASRLTEEFHGAVPDQEVRSLVTEVYGEMSDAKVTQFVPVLIDRRVRAALRLRHAS